MASETYVDIEQGAPAPPAPAEDKTKPHRQRPAFTANNAVCILYVIAALVVFPLYSKHSYTTLAQDKLDFFVPATIAFLALTAVVLLLRTLFSAGRTLRRPEAFTVSDAMMLLFFGAVVVSWQLSAWPQEAYWGSDYRHHGVVIVAMYFIAYFLLSRFARRLDWVPAAFLIGGLPVFWIGLQNFLGRDPLGFARHSTPYFMQSCISTIGNWNFYASFVCLYLAVMCAMFLKSRSLPLTVFYGFGVFAGCFALICGSSDSGFVGLAALLVLLPFFVVNWKQLAHFALIPSLLFLAGKAIQLFTLQNGGVTRIPLRGISKMLIDGISGWVFLLVCAGAAVFFLILHRAKPNASFPRALKAVWGVVLAAGFLAVILAVLYFSAVDTSTPLGGFEKYLRFNDMWGSTRGFAWSRAIKEYASYPPLEKLFGTGIDTAKHLYLPKYYSAMMALGGRTFENVHNEYLQYLVTIGAVGTVGYIGLIASVVARAFRRSKKSPLLIAFGIAVLCYAAQGFFNITQTMTTPVFFVLLALTEACSRASDAAARRSERLKTREARAAAVQPDPAADAVQI